MKNFVNNVFVYDTIEAMRNKVIHRIGAHSMDNLTCENADMVNGAMVVFCHAIGINANYAFDENDD